jgi:hypothetical protein
MPNLAKAVVRATEILANDASPAFARATTTTE